MHLTVLAGQLVWFGTKERGFYPLTAALGLGAVLSAVNIDEDPKRPALWAALGVTSVLALWMSPNVLYFAPGIALWLALRGHLRELRGIAVAALAFLAGSSV